LFLVVGSFPEGQSTVAVLRSGDVEAIISQMFLPANCIRFGSKLADPKRNDPDFNQKLDQRK
jgi:hypothetical protein